MKISKFLRIWGGFNRRVKRLLLFPLQKSLGNLKKEQKIRFESLKKNLPDVYYNLKKNDFDRFITSFWKVQNDKLEKDFIPEIPFSFLKNPVITQTMFVNSGTKWRKSELKFLEKLYSKRKLKMLLMEDFVGEPPLQNIKFFTSYNSIHHLHHIKKFFVKTGCDLKNLTTVIEWGGGYGNLAKIFDRLADNKKTYIIIDTPLMSCLQWLYLATILGLKKVNFIKDLNEKIEFGKINILPICFIDQFKLKADLFISTWALTESSTYSQEYVLKFNWFDSKHILLGYNDRSTHFPDIIKREIANRREFINEEIDFIPGNRYAFL